MQLEATPLMNPFTPTFGEAPIHMAGRSRLLGQLQRAFEAPNRHPSLTTAITGARGTGKTALLSRAADDAMMCGWVVARTVAIPGMLEDILISARRSASHLVTTGALAQVTGIEVGGALGVEWSREESLSNWRNDMTDLLEQLDSTQTGLLITVDEVQPTLPEMIQLAAVYQLFVTEGRRVALLMAGLPNNMLALEKDKTVSFLRRSQKCHLGRIADRDVELAMRQTIEDYGRTIDAEALKFAVAAADGFPFMMQLVGFHMWEIHPSHMNITLEDAQTGAHYAEEEMKDRILGTTYYSLSEKDQAFLRAMLQDENESDIRNIAHRMQKTLPYVNQYKRRLLGQGVIEEDVQGKLTYALPLMREYVKEREG